MITRSRIEWLTWQFAAPLFERALGNRRGGESDRRQAPKLRAASALAQLQ